MTANQTAAFERAFARAIAECITVLDEGVDADGRPFYTVSGSRPNTQYLVIQINAAQFACTCPAGQNGVICKHRAACRAKLMAQASAAALAVATQEAQRAADDDAREMELYPGYAADLDAAAARIQAKEAARLASGADYDEFEASGFDPDDARKDTSYLLSMYD